MAKKKERNANGDDSNVVRIKADAPSSGKQQKARETVAVTAEPIAGKVQPAKSKRARNKKNWLKPVTASAGYFKGAWDELRQVRWPTRRATWSLTGAVLLYTAFFILLILLLDFIFQKLFELILGK